MSLRHQVYEVLEDPDRTGPVAKWIDIGLITLIACNVMAVMAETIPSVYAQYKPYFDAFELFSVAIFTIEYLARLWVCPEREDYTSRKAYALRPMSLIDLLAILPSYISAFVGMDLRFLRALRLLRIFKLTRYSSAMTMLLDVFYEEASAFFAAFSILLVLLVFAASGIYLAEHLVQPEAFGSIPQSMWWAMVTLTTVGYGDVYPITTAGRIFGGFVTIIGVGMAALPAGIMASGLADQLHRRRDDLRKQFRVALEDGQICDDEELEIETLRKELGISKEIAESIQEEVMAKMKNTTCPKCGAEFHR